MHRYRPKLVSEFFIFPNKIPILIKTNNKIHLILILILIPNTNT
jgi:hypothetical protein